MIIGVLGLVVSITGAALSVIEPTALAGWIVAGVGIIIGVVGLLSARVSKPLAAGTALIAVAGLVAGLVLNATVYDDDDDATSSSVTGPSAAPTTGAGAPTSPSRSPSRSSSGSGTRNSPYALGSPVVINDWEVTVFEPYEGLDEILEYSPFAEPEPGIEFWLFPIEAKNLSGEPRDVWWDLTAGFEAADGTAYGGFCAGTIPEDLYDYDEVEPGQTVSGNLCVEKGAGATGLWTLSVDFGPEVYFD